jgi:hypothetical protein
MMYQNSSQTPVVLANNGSQAYFLSVHLFHPITPGKISMFSRNLLKTQPCILDLTNSKHDLQGCSPGTVLDSLFLTLEVEVFLMSVGQVVLLPLGLT